MFSMFGVKMCLRNFSRKIQLFLHCPVPSNILFRPNIFLNLVKFLSRTTLFREIMWEHYFLIILNLCKSLVPLLPQKLMFYQINERKRNKKPKISFATLKQKIATNIQTFRWELGKWENFLRPLQLEQKDTYIRSVCTSCSLLIENTFLFVLTSCSFSGLARWCATHWQLNVATQVEQT